MQYWYPDNYHGACPLVVFSHGGMGIRSSNLSLYVELASWGYVVASINHTYQALYTIDDLGKKTLISKEYLNEIKNENAKINKENSYQCYQSWLDIRMGDINYVIDYSLQKSKDNSSDEVFKLIDSTKIGVMGHSLGGSAALAIGRVRSDISCVMALESPFLYDIIDVQANEFIWNNDEYPIPVLNIYTDGTYNKLASLSQYQKNYKYLITPRNDTFSIYLKGTGHFTITNLALTTPYITKVLNSMNDTKATMDSKICLQYLNQIALAYFDCYLKSISSFIPAEFYE